MHINHIEKMFKGWFAGDFTPTAYKTDDFEAGLKSYSAGDFEEWHYHKVATEITLIVSGDVEMNGKRYGPGDIIIMEPGEGTDFKAITNAVNVVIKHPGVLNDKYLKRE